MDENTGLKILSIPGAILSLIGIGYAYGLAVSGCPKPTMQARIYAIDLTLVASGILLASGTAIVGYQTGIKSSSIRMKEQTKRDNND